MDLITISHYLLLIFFVGPFLIIVVPLKAYLSIVCLFLIVYIGFLWLIENLTPAESQSRRQSRLGLLQVYPPESSTPQFSRRTT
jgi:hypothetical protein